MILINKVLISLIALVFSFNFTYADNKSELLSEISTLETNYNNLKTSSISSLETKVTTLSNNYDNLFVSLWYDIKTVGYLVSLWKISSNFKADLVLELSTLKNDILSKINSELSSLNNVKDDITYKYTTISDNEKANFLVKINIINDNYKNLSDSFSWKINILDSKYTNNLISYTNNIKTIFEGNKSIIDNLKNFSSKYEDLYKLNIEFEQNYNQFKDFYLSFAWNLQLFNETKQKEYVESLKKELEKIRDLNIEWNKSLENYKPDIDRFIKILLENFENSLYLKINESYGIIYSDTDINSITSRFNTAKNRYYDLDWNLKATEVLSNTWSVEEIIFLNEKLSFINTKIKDLLGTGSTSNTIDNIKIRLENEMVRFYNENYKNYREDLLLKLKEKLNITALETKNILLAADTIDLRFSFLNDKISKSNDMIYINSQIERFKKDAAKYSYLNSSILDTKIKNLDTNLLIYVIEKELSQFKYSKMSKIWYETQLAKIFSWLKTKYPEKYKDKLNIVLTKIDKLLNTQISDKKRFMILVIKLEILRFTK